MVIDSSALVAILLGEAESEAFTSAILAAPARLVGAPSYLETAIVLIGRLGAGADDAVDLLLQRLGAELVPFGPDQARRALGAFRRHGKGGHPAALNFGDCCSYALAAETGEGLLFKGQDFARSDLRPALAP